jgi:sugar lactone lactonase YvrE
VSNNWGWTIARYTADGAGSVFAALGGMNGPQGLAFDSEGQLYVANEGNSTVTRLSPEGQPILFADKGLSHPTGMAIDRVGNICSTWLIRSSGGPYRQKPGIREAGVRFPSRT